MTAMMELENFCIEMCPDCKTSTCLTIIDEDGSAVYACSSPQCKNVWEPKAEKIESLLTMGLI